MAWFRPNTNPKKWSIKIDIAKTKPVESTPKIRIKNRILRKKLPNLLLVRRASNRTIRYKIMYNQLIYFKISKTPQIIVLLLPDLKISKSCSVEGRMLLRKIQNFLPNYFQNSANNSKKQNRLPRILTYSVI